MVKKKSDNRSPPTSNKSDNTTKIPIIIGNANPFRLVVRKTDLWKPTLEQVNNRSYDYVKLHRLSTYIDVGIRPFSLGIAFDGSLILPRTFSDKHSALKLFNKSLCEMLLGGIYSEAVLPENICLGYLTLDGYYNRVTNMEGSISRFHHAILKKHGGALDTIRLLNPPMVSIEEIMSAIDKGREILQKIPHMTPNIFLNGITHFVKHEWAQALICLWTSIEQVISGIWIDRIVDKSSKVDKIPGRQQFLKDYRTWPVSAKCEVLYQNKMIGISEYCWLNEARQARNDFAHNGNSPDLLKVESAVNALFSIISLVLSEFQELKLLNGIKKAVIEKQHQELTPNSQSIKSVSHWLPLPPIPGDSNWGNTSYEIIEELRLKRIKSS